MTAPDLAQLRDITAVAAAKKMADIVLADRSLHVLTEEVQVAGLITPSTSMVVLGWLYELHSASSTAEAEDLAASLLCRRALAVGCRPRGMAPKPKVTDDEVERFRSVARGKVVTLASPQAAVEAACRALLRVMAELADPLAVFSETGAALSLEGMRAAVGDRLKPALGALQEGAVSHQDANSTEWAAPAVIDDLLGARSRASARRSSTICPQMATCRSMRSTWRSKFACSPACRRSR